MKKMKKKLLNMTILGAMFGVSLGSASIALAAEPVEDASANTKASISILPVDENDQPDEVEEDANKDGEETGQRGQFTIDQVPKFDFGEMTVSGGNKFLNAKDKLAVQVSDRRTVGSGWDLSVQLGEFINQDPTAEVKAQKLTGVNLEMIILDELLANKGNTNIAPTKHDITIDAGGDSANLLTAAADTEEISGIGRGSWLGKFADGSTEPETNLFVPGGNYDGNYQADLTWTLSQTL